MAGCAGAVFESQVSGGPSFAAKAAPRSVTVTVAFDGGVSCAQNHHVANGACAAAPSSRPARVPACIS